MAKIDKHKVEYIANLARIEIADAELDDYSRDLIEIIGFIEKINKLDLTNIPPSFNLHNTSDIYRNDQIRKFDEVNLIRDIFPEKEGAFIKIPKVID